MIVNIGIDPGLSGAVCFLSDNRLVVIDMPSLEVKSKGKELNWDFLANEMWNVRSEYDCLGDFQATIENVHAMPKQGVSSSFKFGYVSGGIRGILASMAIPVQMVQPAKWKRDLGLHPGKDASRELASRLYPVYAHKFSRKKDDGRAEAVLIAHWARSKEN